MSLFQNSRQLLAHLPTLCIAWHLKCAKSTPQAWVDLDAERKRWSYVRVIVNARPLNSNMIVQTLCDQAFVCGSTRHGVRGDWLSLNNNTCVYITREKGTTITVQFRLDCHCAYNIEIFTTTSIGNGSRDKLSQKIPTTLSARVVYRDCHNIACFDTMAIRASRTDEHSVNDLDARPSSAQPSPEIDRSGLLYAPKKKISRNNMVTTAGREREG